MDNREFELIFNALMIRENLFKYLADPRKNVEGECNYVPTSELTVENHYLPFFERHPIATRVVEAYPNECWNLGGPDILEDEDMDTETPFEKRFKEVCRGLSGDMWNTENETHIFWDYLRRIDIISGIGHYGVLLLGIDDGKDLSEPIDGVDEDGMHFDPSYKPKGNGNRNLLYMRCFSENLAKIIRFVNDERSPRNGFPLAYNLSINTPSADLSSGSALQTQRMIEVHWSRVIHVADTLESNEYLAVPRMRPVYDDLFDLRKLYGGSAEMYWRGAFPGISFETHPQLGGQVDIDTDKLKSELQNYFKGLQRYLTLTGMSAKTIAPQVVDPTPQIKARLEAIAVKVDIPMRILLGSERGELASSQDADRWQGKLMNRKLGYLSPRMVIPTISRLIMMDVLPVPPKGYKVRWPDSDILSPDEKASIAQKLTVALTTFLSQGGEQGMTLEDYMVEMLGFSDSKAKDLAKRARDNAGDNVTSSQPQPTGTPVPPPSPALTQRDATPQQPTTNQLLNFVSNEGADGTNCGTGAGGFKPGNTCGKGGGNNRSGIRGIKNEYVTPPPPGKVFNPNVLTDKNKDGVTDSARVGVPAMTVPPPPKIGRLPNLTTHERRVENAFIRAYEKDPDGIADSFRKLVAASTKPGDPKTFGTDDAKALTSAWSGNHLTNEQRAQNRATLNTPLHQTANAIAKRAFVRELDTLKAGDEILVTVGGCGAGKGYALKNVPQALEMKKRSSIVWDSAGDQNATENPWIQAEAEKRGLKVNYIYVHADPKTQWAHPERGVMQRAANPEDGRMVDAMVFADSYALGARNHQKFYEQHKNNQNANFVFLSNIGKPELIHGVPDEALKINRKKLTTFAVRLARTTNAPAHVKRGALIGQRIWKD